MRIMWWQQYGMPADAASDTMAMIACAMERDLKTSKTIKSKNAEQNTLK